MNLSVSIRKTRLVPSEMLRAKSWRAFYQVGYLLSDSIWPVKKETELRFYNRSSCLDYVNFNSGCMQNVRFSWQIVAFSSFAYT